MIPFDSKLLGGSLTTTAMAALWSEERLLASWIAVWRAITEAQAEMEIIPLEAARDIVAHLEPDRLPLERIAARSREAGHTFVGFLRAFREGCGPAAEHFHVGPTTQDILDTALVLQLREAQTLIDDSLARLVRALCRRAEEYRDTPMMGRTHEQHALPCTFGFVLAGWALELQEHVERGAEARERWLLGCLSGGVGTQSAFVALTDTRRARELERRVCERLDLPVPVMDLHTRLDRFAELTSYLALLTATLGRIGLHLRTMERPEVGEIRLRYGEDACNSSTMPNKRNPDQLENVQGLAQLVAGHASAMLATRPADHRDSTRVPVLYAALPQSFAMAHVGTVTVADAIETLEADPHRMHSNIHHPANLGQAVCERVMIAMYRKTGRRHEAHSLLSRLAHESRTSRRPIRELMELEPDLRARFEDAEWEALFRLEEYTGTAAAQVDAVVARIRSVGA
jgi:adenylosuccinate lyase